MAQKRAAKKGSATGKPAVSPIRAFKTQNDFSAWLEKNQRASGRWFTRSLNTDSYHFITHAGTAYAVMALHACQK